MGTWQASELGTNNQGSIDDPPSGLYGQFKAYPTSMDYEFIDTGGPVPFGQWSMS